jgi:hypothetical protein
VKIGDLKLPRKTKSPGTEKTQKPRRDLVLDDLVGSLDPQTLARLRDALTAPAANRQHEVLDQLDDLLRRLESPGDSEIAEDEALIDHVVAELVQLSADSNGGDPEAREITAAIDEKLEAALNEDRFDAASLVLLAKILSDSKWAVPARLKTRLIEALDAAPPAEPSEFDLKTALRQIAEAAGDDAFAAYEALGSVLAAFPSDAAARMIGVLGVGREPVLLQTLAGFVMHADPDIALAAVAGLKSAASGRQIESALVERLVRMRPWLPQERQTPLDDAIRALRAHALPPREVSRPTPLKAFVMACDGMGSAGVLATLKGPRGWGFVAAMARPEGVAEVMSLDSARKADIDATVRGMRDSVATAQTDAAGVGRYLQVCLGENAVSRTPPPFRLLGLVEAMGLGPLAPRSLTPGELIAEILEGAPVASPAILANAHIDVTRTQAAAAWFEAGEMVDRLLRPIRGPNARARALLGGYLEQRREFWGRICAMTAFALSLGGKPDRVQGLNLARVGREILTGTPLASIPLMRQVAETTVLAFEDRV